jgi:hypothetical protein
MFIHKNEHSERANMWPAKCGLWGSSLCLLKFDIFRDQGPKKLDRPATWPYNKCLHLFATVQGIYPFVNNIYIDLICSITYVSMKHKTFSYRIIIFESQQIYTWC